MIGFRMPTHVLVEPGAVTRLPEAARSLAMQSCLLVVDPERRVRFFNRDRRISSRSGRCATRFRPMVSLNRSISSVACDRLAITPPTRTA